VDDFGSLAFAQISEPVDFVFSRGSDIIEVISRIWFSWTLYITLGCYGSELVAPIGEELVK
jgi:hypothetical protein